MKEIYNQNIGITQKIKSTSQKNYWFQQWECIAAETQESACQYTCTCKSTIA